MKKELTRRILMTILGVAVSGFSVGMFNFSAFGMDPFQVLAHGVCGQLPMGLNAFGTFYTILNLLMLTVIFFLDRKKIGLGTLINIFLVGYMVQASSALWQSLLPSPTFLIRAAALVVGIVLMCFGSALYFTADLGVSTYDAVALILAQRTRFKFQYCRIASDLVCTLVGYLLGAVVGVGTLFTAFFMGPFVAFFNRTVAIPIRYGKGGKPDSGKKS